MSEAILYRGVRERTPLLAASGVMSYRELTYSTGTTREWCPVMWPDALAEMTYAGRLFWSRNAPRGVT